MTKQYGASAQEWDHFTGLELSEDLLPVVSDPNAQISPNSGLKSLGKVPSLFDRKGQVVGISKWTAKRASRAEIAQWKADDRLGICVQTRRVRAIDIDVPDEELARMIEIAFQLELGNLPVRSRADSGKRLLAVRVDGALTKQVFDVAGGRVEILGDGQQFVAVGTHPSGARYEWGGGLPQEIPTVSMADLEAAIATVREAYAIQSSGRSASKDSQRDFDSDAALLQVDEDTLLQLEAACDFLAPLIADDYILWQKIGQALKSLDRVGFAEQAYRLWHKFSKGSSRYSRQEAEAKWKSFTADRTDFRAAFAEAYRKGWQRPGLPAFEDDLTDAGNVDVLAWVQPGTLRFVAERALWIFWDGATWHWDEEGSASQTAVLGVSQLMLDRARAKRARLQDASLDAVMRAKLEQEVRALSKWAHACRNRTRIRDCLALATRDPRFTLSVGHLDRDPHLLGVRNGVVDLRTGELRSNSREDFVLRRCDIDYSPAARNERWIQFVSEVTGTLEEGKNIRPRPELRDYLKRALGYSLTGLTREHKMFLAVGSGSNGKNVLLDTGQAVLGRYSVSLAPEALMTSRWNPDVDRPSPALAALAGARFVVSSESRDGQRLDTAVVKRHTGGGRLSARFMRENSFEFEMSHKLWLMTNHKPDVDLMDDAMRARLHIVPFEVRWNRPGEVSPDARLPDGDKALAETLSSNLQGVLTWLVEGAQEYFERGLEPPQEVLDVTKEYLEDQDAVGRFVAASTPCDLAEGTLARKLYDAFNAWTTNLGERIVMSGKSFSQALKRLGIPSHKKERGVVYGLKPPEIDSEF